MKLYTYFRSSASYRVRIALNLKGLDVEMIPVNLLKGEQKSDEYTRLNPQQLLPALIDGKHLLTQSLAIMEYLEDTHAEPSILPEDPVERARVRALALAVACEIAPLNNLKVLKYLVGPLKLGDETKKEWLHHWIAQGFTAIERSLKNSPSTGKFCHGDTPTIADCCLVPQIFNAMRFECDLTPYPTIMRIAGNCNRHPAFIAAHPANQADTV